MLKILVRTMLLVRADLLRKVFGVCVSLDLRVRFAKEVNTTFMMISLDFQFNNNKQKLYPLHEKTDLNRFATEVNMMQI